MIISDKILMGFEFEDEETYTHAKREVDNLQKIQKKYNIKSKEKVLEFYNKLIEEEIFVTPIGIEYLRKLQRELYDSENINNEDIRPIPAKKNVEKADRSIDRSIIDDTLGKAEKKVSKYKESYMKMLIVNLVLVIIIVVMFAITKRAEKYDLDYYRESIENDYINWENNLREREENLREQATDIP